MINLRPVFEFTWAVEQSIFFQQVQDSFGTVDGRLVLFPEQYVNSMQTFFGQCTYGSWT